MLGRFALLPITFAVTLALSACGSSDNHDNGSTPVSSSSSSSSGSGQGSSSSSSSSGGPVDRSGTWPAAALNDPDPVLAGKEPVMPSDSDVCATVKATQTRNDKGLLDSSLDSDPANSQPDTALIQNAINNCPVGKAVKLIAADGKDAFLSGPLNLATYDSKGNITKSTVTLWIDKGVTLFASRSPKDYQIDGKNTCGEDSASDNGCNPLINVVDSVNSAIVGEGVIDGRGGEIVTSGKYANKLTWWDIGALSKTAGTNQNNPRLIKVVNKSSSKLNSKGFTLYKITLQNSPKFHFTTTGVDGVTVWGVKVLTPTLAYSKAGYACDPADMPATSGAPNYTRASTCFTPDTTKNTDAIDPGQSKNVLIAYNHISTGDDGIAIKAQTSSGGYLSSNIRVLHNRFYFTHGMSIGSETDLGVNDMVVRDLTIDGNDANFAVGIRIKTDSKRGGEVQKVTYDGVCVRRAQEALTMDAYYTTSTGALYPNIHDITVKNYHYVNYPGSIYNDSNAMMTFRGYNDGSINKPLYNIFLDNVVFDGMPALKSVDASAGLPPVPSSATVTLSGNVSFASLLLNSINLANNFNVLGMGTGSAAPYDCSSAFVPFPSDASPI